MRSSLLKGAVAASLMLPLAALAERPVYSYIEAGYVVTDVDGISDNLDGFALVGSAALTENLFLFAGYAQQSASPFGIDVDFKSYTVGGGYAWPLSDTLDVYGEVGYVKAEADVEGFGDDDDGYSLAAGVRAFVLDQLELEGALTFVDLSDSGSDTSFGAAARWYFTPQFAVGFEAGFSDDANSYGITARVNWGD